MRFGSDDQGKGLKRRCDTHLRVKLKKSAPFDLTQIIDLTVRRYGPQYIRGIAGAKLKGPRHLGYLKIDLRSISACTLYSGVALHPRESCGSAKLYSNQVIQRIRYCSCLAFYIDLTELRHGHQNNK